MSSIFRVRNYDGIVYFEKSKANGYYTTVLDIQNGGDTK